VADFCWDFFLIKKNTEKTCFFFSQLFSQRTKKTLLKPHPTRKKGKKLLEKNIVLPLFSPKKLKK